jgi:hypothetical protein
MTNDPQLLIFGNSELRLNPERMTIFSNLGISRGFYDSFGADYNALLCAGEEREVPIEGYEIYRV